MVDYEAGRKCKKCGEVLRVDEFRYKNRRKDGRHLICFDCEPPGGFSTRLLDDELEGGSKKYEPGAVTTRCDIYAVEGEARVVQEHFLMLASSCEDIAKQLENTIIDGAKETQLNKQAGKAAAKISEAIKILS